MRYKLLSTESAGEPLAYRGFSLAALGQTQEAFALLIKAMAHLHTVGAVAGLPVLLAGLAQVATSLGQPAEAWRYLTWTLAVSGAAW